VLHYAFNHGHLSLLLWKTVVAFLLLTEFPAESTLSIHNHSSGQQLRDVAVAVAKIQSHELLTTKPAVTLFAITPMIF